MSVGGRYRNQKSRSEYRAQKLKDAKGKIHAASFPEGIASDVQYGNAVKAHSAYMLQFQLLPYSRIRGYFAEQMCVPLSGKTMFNFNRAYNLLETFEGIAKNKLIESPVNNADEPGININEKKVMASSGFEQIMDLLLSS